MTDRTMRQRIRQIPGDDGWWHCSSEDDYQALAKKLRGLGLTAEVVVEVLTGAFAAAANEFGR